MVSGLQNGPHMTITAFYWNMHRRNDLGDLARRLVVVAQADLVILSECTSPPETMAATLSVPGGPLFRYLQAPGESKNFVFASLPKDSAQAIGTAWNGRLAFHKVVHHAPEILLASVHLIDPINNSLDARNQFANQVADRIRKEEELRNHKRTIVIGDFNLEPYDLGLTGVFGFNAIECRQVIHESESRTVQTVEIPYFYNPMWNLLGDLNGRSAGTFYMGPGDGTRTCWRMLDQILVRRALLGKDGPQVSILQTSELLTRNGRPSASVASDHLPIVARIET